ncbi:MAG: toxic anion resistance protein [Deltaproteobacteria bacterium]|nr:toxic anion resistance protein [Deltaproteobacteria bacterium]
MKENRTMTAEIPTPDVPAALDTSNEETRLRVHELAASIDPADAHSILFFGSSAQTRLNELSERMLAGVKNKDLEDAGGMLGELVGTVRGFDVQKLDPSRKPTFIERLLGRGRPLARFIQRYEEVAQQVDAIGDELERHKTLLLTDLVSLERLYDANLESFQSLELHIEAARQKLAELDKETIPARESAAAASGNTLAAQALRDLRSARDDLDRRFHDLLLTRHVTMQALPGIRLVQQNDKGLVGKIESTLTNTMPLWRQQLATAVTLYRSGAAAQTVQAASDLTNELLEANAEKLRSATAEARGEIERGVFDIESVKRANEQLVAAIEDSLRISDAGKRARAEAAADLAACEAELRKSLAAAAAREAEAEPVAQG